ncbi:nitrilase-related carbon-nitrogen hydrolase [Xanthomonas sp. 3075]|uniref:nitrilase-related carbon-nitrogen hydrolase n=1 Tax=Xanthomonas sp. 3075 TaxID=3035315 RepID=UPI00161D4336|nr:nitrilase-related carbon-nitrogen hydrolase [Xanthomonas sp. 3075]MBB4131291.1 apolipoprotein N-acyltransferase [Xanthomonas sp. 3075]
MDHTPRSPTRLLPAALFAGAALWLGVGLQPPWWWVWLAPAPVLWLAYTIERKAHARIAVLLATTVAATHYVPYFGLVMPLPAVVLATCAIALLWSAVVMGARGVVRCLRNGWSVLAYPLLWVCADLLMARLLPDGNWGSPAYTQADVLPLLQLTALTGVSGLLFVLCLVPSALALLVWRGHAVRRPVLVLAAVTLTLAASAGYGMWRLQTPATGSPLRIGLAAIDDSIGPSAAPVYWQPVRNRYDALIATLAAQGAQLVVLPEKIAVLPPQQLAQWQQHYSALARKHRLWVLIGIAEHGAQPRNLAWLFDPQGVRVERYEKQFLAPPERAQQYAHGTDYAIHRVDDMRWGLAICKDMLFAQLARANGQRNAALMLVPAWDFAYRDAWMSAQMTALRGVENGYTVVRNAREGFLSVTDAYGRVQLQTRSAPMPGTSAIVDVRIGPHVTTLYTRIGDVFGGVCALALLVLALLTRRQATSNQRGDTADR